MKHVVAFTAGLLILIALTSCTPDGVATAPPATTSPRPSSVTVSPPSVTAASAAAAPQFGTPTATSTIADVTPTSTLPLETPLPTSTPAAPTPVIPSGLYVTYLNTIPDPPQRGLELVFHVGFANTTAKVQDFRWIVYIYKSDNLARSFGETTVTQNSEPVGAHEYTSLGFWKLPLGGPCEDYVARVAWLDQDNRAAQFKEPNGQLFEKKLTVCPP